MTATVGTAKGPEEQYFKASALLSPWGQRCDGCPPNSPFVLKVLGPARGEKKKLKRYLFYRYMSVLPECLYVDQIVANPQKQMVVCRC